MVDSIKYLLTDKLHWIGWLLSTTAVFFGLKLFGLSLSFKWLIPMLLILVVVDVFKHQIRLQ